MKFLKLFIIFMILSLFIFNYYNLSNQEELGADFSQLKISTDIYDSLKFLEEKALLKQEEFNFWTKIKLGFIGKGDLISPHSTLIIQLDDLSTNNLTQYNLTMPNAFVGLTSSQLASLADDWLILAGEEILFLYQNYLPLASVKDVLSLGVKEGRVAIFYGENQNKLKQLTDIKVKDLPQEVQESLKDGIIIRSEEELLTILEGIISIILD